MKNSRASLIIIVGLLLVAALLSYGVATKMKHTAVTAEDRQLDPQQFGISTIESTPSNKDAPLAVFIGDFTQGSGLGGVGGENWTNLLATEIRKTMPLRIAVDNQGEGSGYVIRGPSPLFSDEVRSLVNADTKLVVISGSRNDVVAAPSDVNARAREVYGVIAQLAPAAQVVAIGPTWGDDPPSPEILATRDAIRDAATASNVLFVDPLADDWFTGGEPGLIGSDSVHPTDRGNEVMAQKLFPIFANLLGQQGIGGG